MLAGLLLVAIEEVLVGNISLLLVDNVDKELVCEVVVVAALVEAVKEA